MNNISLITGDARSLDIPNNSINLIVTNPPYLGIDTQRYGGDSSKQINASKNKKKMLKLLVKATKEMERVLTSGGHLWIANGIYDNLDMEYVIETLKHTNLKYIDSIVHTFFNHSGSYEKYEKIADITKVTWHHFYKDGIVYHNPFEVKKYNDPIWNLPENNMDDAVDIELSKTYHVLDVMPKEIPKRLILMFSKRGDIVLDPFGGSGIVAATAAELGRVGISNDVSETQTKSAEKRIKLTLKK